MRSLKITTAILLLAASLSAAANTPFGDHVQFRGSLGNCRIRFQNDRKGTVAFIGGSITEMNGYRPMVCDLLKKRFPQTDFKFIDAGIASTTSTTGAFRLAHDVLEQGPVDLFFVEFAVNDDQDGHYSRTECIRGMEGLIRHALQSNPDINIIMTFFTNESMIKTLQEGHVPLTIESHGAVAERYDVSTINLAAEAARQITAGELTWKKYGGVHPAPFGNAICASMIDELLNRAWAGPIAAAAALAPQAVPEPLDPLSYDHGRFIDPGEAKIVTGWTLGIPDWKSLPGGKRERFTSIPILSATEPGAEATLRFEGTCVGAYVLAGPDAGIVDASVDGGAPTAVDLLHAYSKGLHYPRTVILGADLKPGRHTLTLRISSETHSAGHAMA